MCSVSELDEAALLAEIRKDFGWDREKAIDKLRNYAQTHSSH